MVDSVNKSRATLSTRTLVGDRRSSVGSLMPGEFRTEDVSQLVWDRHQEALERWQLPRLWDQSVASPQVSDGVSAMSGEDDLMSHPVEVALVGYLRGSRMHQRRQNVSLTMSDLLQYITLYARDTIPQLWLTYSDETGAPIRPDRIMIAVRKDGSRDERASGLRMIDATAPIPDDLSDSLMQLTFAYDLRSHYYHLVDAHKGGAMEVAFTYLEACGVTVKSKIAQIYVARLLGSQLSPNDLMWPDFLDDITSDAILMRTLWDVRGHIVMDRLPFPQRVVFVATRYDDDRVHGVRLLTDTEAKSEHFVEKMGRIFIEKTADNQLSIVGIRGYSAQDLGYSWIASQIGRPLHLAEKVMSVALWKSRYRSKIEIPEWHSLLDYLKEPGALSALWQVRELIRPVGKMPDKLALVARKERGLFSGFALLTESELKVWPTNNATGIVHLEKNKSGVYEPVSWKGANAKDLADVLVPPKNEGGVTFAPDAGQTDGVAESVSRQPGIFVGDDLASKPEPLITPADVMPVPQLERPADSVELPKEGGFQITDAEAVRKFATPPSDKIPSAVRPQENTMVTVQHVYQRGFVKSGDSVAGGVAAVFDHYFAAQESAYLSDNTALGSAKAAGLALSKVAATLPFALGDAVHRIVSDVPKGPVPTVARAAQIFISGPFEGAAHLGRGARQAWDSRGHMTAPRNAYVWTQLASQLALIVVGGAKAAKGVGGFMDGIGPDLLPVAAGDSMVAVATVSVPAVPAQVVAGALMMSVLPPDFGKAAEGVVNGAKSGSLKPDEIVALWRFLIPKTPPQLARAMVSAVLTTLPHDAVGAIAAVVDLMRRLVEIKADGGLRALLANTIEPQLKGAWNWGRAPELWSGIITELSKGSPKFLPGVGHQFLKWVSYSRKDQAFQTAAPQIWQQLLDSLVAIEGPERIHMMNALGNKIQGRSGLTPTMESAFEKASQSVRGN